ncbi:MAG: hypothetical protein QGH60_09460 [Phycisphaerae bacterium]|jgi:hypothetical protein|nr:hypothetical protein [Phycisphaerae bacterium]
MTEKFPRLKTIGRRILACSILAVTLTVLTGTVSGCKNMLAEKQYTILLHTFSGPNHVRQSKFYRDKTKELAGWKGLDVVHKDSHSELYWGKYRSIPSAEGDLKTARTWHVPNVTRTAFPFPKVVLIPGKEVEMPQYNLLNVSEGHWTVLVAIYVDDPSQGFVGRDRQKHTLEYCQWLRKQGYEAYYHHMSGRSQVTVGTFPENAVVVEAQASPKPDVFVAKQVIKSEKMRKIMATRSPPLLFLVVNDHTEYEKRRSRKTGKTVKVIVSSRPIPIPKRSPASNPLR